MNKAWAALLWFGIGFGIGIFAGERIGRKKIQKKEEKEPEMTSTMPEKEVSDQSTHPKYNAWTPEELAKQAGYYADPSKADDDEEEPDDFDKDVAEMELYLSSFEHPMDDDEEPESSFPFEHKVENEEGKEPYAINFEDFYRNGSGFDQSYLMYYEEDEVLCDESESIVEESDKVLGEGWYGRFGDNEDDPDTIYIRNERMKTDYEVSRIKNAYSRVVMGMEDNDDN